VDASQALLEMACAGAEDDDCEALGIKADISSPMHLLLAADVSEAPRLFLMVGNTLAVSIRSTRSNMSRRAFTRATF